MSRRQHVVQTAQPSRMEAWGIIGSMADRGICQAHARRPSLLLQCCLLQLQECLLECQRPRTDLHACKASCLGDDRGAIEGGGHDPVEVLLHRCAICKLQSLRDHSPAQPHSCESCILAEGAGLNGHLLSACNETHTRTVMLLHARYTWPE